jgi:hypothetical protein
LKSSPVDGGRNRIPAHLNQKGAAPFANDEGRAYGEEVNANEPFKNKRKPAIHWFGVAHLHDYRIIAARTEPRTARLKAGRAGVFC